ncbi:HAMP domain-containing sensor histidine kinase [Streptomyces sp. NPDC020719]|uniref:sensor histidine kinase n=1 Tax=Streptomyces sp. NPDC020719 TaxID=3154896 RepID=UPI0033D4F62A
MRARSTRTSPALARLVRLRRRLTVLFAATTAACLVVLAFVASSIDDRSRADGLDKEIARRADGLARAVWMDNGTLHLEPLAEDTLAREPGALAVLSEPKAPKAPTTGKNPEVRWSRPGPAALPDDARLDGLWRRVREQQETVYATETSRDGKTLRWAASPVWDEDSIGAAVLAAADPGPGERDHETLVRWLALGGTGLVLAAALVGHLLSGRSMREALRALDQQEQFLAEAAHELRTPLATLRVTLEAGSAAESARLVDRMGRLVGGLLTRARVEAGAQEVELTPLRLDQLVEQVVDEVGQVRPGADIVVTAAPVVVAGDPDLLEQAVRNLVENALRHGGATPVEVRVHPGGVAVRDHGPGFPSDASDASGGGGNGIGLAIVRWVADLHGGTVALGPAPGGGALAELRIGAPKRER